MISCSLTLGWFSAALCLVSSVFIALSILGIACFALLMARFRICPLNSLWSSCALFWCVLFLILFSLSFSSWANCFASFWNSLFLSKNIGICHLPRPWCGSLGLAILTLTMLWSVSIGGVFISHSLAVLARSWV